MKKIIYCLLFALISIAANGQAKYVFYFIGDGMGLNQVNGTEMFQAERNDRRIGIEPLRFTQFPYVTMATTFSTTNSVTDSSAAGTALATGRKTYNHAVSMDANQQPLETIAEKAQKAGRKVGIATTVSIDHATPAAFYAHQADRNMFYEIAQDLIRANFDFYAGAGFLKPQQTYQKKKAPHLFPQFEAAGYTLIRGQQAFANRPREAHKIILLPPEGKSAKSLPYALDRQPDDLSLKEITENAIEVLTAGKKKGFFLMIEGGKIDWACHNNDAATVFREIKDMDDAVEVAYRFYLKHPKETLIVVTADHETGGIALGRGRYTLNLQALQYQKHSADELSQRIGQLRKEKGSRMTWNDMKAFLQAEMGFWKEVPLTERQEHRLRETFAQSFLADKVEFSQNLYSRNEPLAAVAKEIMNEVAKIGWAHGGHSAGYVPVYAIGAGAHLFTGRMDNTDIPQKIAQAAKYK